MARAKRSSPTVPASTVYTQFIASLKKAGGVYCAECHGYTYPDHREHFDAIALDRHASRVKIVAEFGQMFVVDAHETAANYPSDTPMAIDSELAEVA